MPGASKPGSNRAGVFALPDRIAPACSPSRVGSFRATDAAVAARLLCGAWRCANPTEGLQELQELQEMQEMQELQETGVHLDYLGSPINKLADDISRLFGGDAQTRQKGAAGDAGAAGDRGALGLPGIAYK